MYGKPVVLWAPWFVMVETTEAYGFTAVCVLIVCALIYSRNYLLSIFRLAISKVTSEEKPSASTSNKVHSLGGLSSFLGFFTKVISSTAARLNSQLWRK